MANLDFEANKIANKDLVVPRKPIAPLSSVEPLVLCVKEDAFLNEKGLPDDNSFEYKPLDTGSAAGKQNMAANAIAVRDQNSNLWTGDPIDDVDCANKKYVDDNCVTKVGGNMENDQVYAVDMYGDEKTMQVENHAAFVFGGVYGEIACRKGNGNLMTNTPDFRLDCTNKEYVEQKIAEASSERIPKPIIPFGDRIIPFDRVVAIDHRKLNTDDENNVMVPDDAFITKHIDDNRNKGNEALADFIVARDKNANIWTNTPIDNLDCANKKYVDDAISNVESGGADLSNYYTKGEINDLVGDIETLLGGI